MTFFDTGHASWGHSPEPGPFFIRLDQFFERLTKRDQYESAVMEGMSATSERNSIEQRLAEIQKSISDFSMHLPQGFGAGLSKQFANMLDEEAWEEEDELPSLLALSTFLNMLRSSNTTRRPGIGTNGRGSVTAFWRSESNRLTVDSLPTSQVLWVLSSVNSEGEKESAAGECPPKRLSDVLAPYNPRIWFDR